MHAALKGDEDAKLHRRTRLIVRNLPWSINEEKMEKVFHKFGTVTEVKLPKKEDGRLRGFGFVQFSHGHESAKAIKDRITNFKSLKPVEAEECSLCLKLNRLRV